MVTQGFAPAAFAPLGATYANYIDQQFGASPLAAAYASAFSPFAQLQYLSNPAAALPMQFQAYNASDGSGTINPFGDFLNMATNFNNTTGVGLPFTPLTSAGFAERARGVSDILGTQTDNPNDLRIQERFGTGEDAASRQRRLAEAAVVTQMPFALRGETQNILNRLYNQYITGQNPESYLSMAMGAGDDSLWNRFNVTRPEAQSSAGEGTV